MDRKRQLRIVLVLGALVAISAVSIAVATSRGDSGLSLASAAGIANSAGQVAPANHDQSCTSWLGVTLAMTSDGVTVAQVIADSPADTAGLKRGDVIKAIDGSDVSKVEDVREGVNGKSAGDKVTLRISRDGSEQDVSVTLGDWPAPLPQGNPLLPELNGVSPDEMFGHMLGGQFTFTDADGNKVTATIEAGTVESVDSGAGKLIVKLNDGSSKTYGVEDQDVRPGGGLSDLSEGDKVVVLSVDGDVRAVMAGGQFPFMPGIGGKHRGFGFGHGGFGERGFRHGGEWPMMPEETAPQTSGSGTGA